MFNTEHVPTARYGSRDRNADDKRCMGAGRRWKMRRQGGGITDAHVSWAADVESVSPEWEINKHPQIEARTQRDFELFRPWNSS